MLNGVDLNEQHNVKRDQEKAIPLHLLSPKQQQQQQNNNKNKTKTEKISGEGGKIKSYYTCHFAWTSNARNDHRRKNGKELVIVFQRPVNRKWSPQDELRKQIIVCFLTPSQLWLLYHGESQGVGYVKGGGRAGGGGGVRGEYPMVFNP